MGVNNDQYENAVNLLPDTVRVVELSSNDAWMRDCGPTFVVNDKGDVRLVDWDFNAWGGLYDGLYFPWDKDQLVPQKVAQIEGVDRYKAHLVMEGGSFHVDGEGTLLTTEECLLSPGRNPDMTREQIEEHLRDYLGVEKVVWLGKGIDPDETNGHVDDVACFVRPGVVLAAVTDDEDDWRYELLQDNLRMPAGGHGREGPQLEVHTVPMPAIMEITEEEAWGVDSAEGSHPAAARRQDRRVLPQLPHRQRRHHPADVRRPQRRRGPRDHRRARSPTARSSPCRAARSCSAAATCTASRSSSRAAESAERETTAAGPDGAGRRRLLAASASRSRTGSARAHHLRRRRPARDQLLAPRLAVGLEQVAAVREERLGRLVVDQDLQLRLERAERAEALLELVHERVGDALRGGAPAPPPGGRRRRGGRPSRPSPCRRRLPSASRATRKSPGSRVSLSSVASRTVRRAHPQVAALPQHVDDGVVVHGELGDGDARRGP